MEGKLIEAVKAYIFIYDKSCKLYRNKTAIENAWEDISKTLRIPAAQCISRWQSLRNNYTKALAKDKNVPSGSGGGTKKKFKYMEELGFLRPYLQRRKTFGNIDESPVENQENLEEVIDCTYDEGFSSNIQTETIQNESLLEDSLNDQNPHENSLDSDEELFARVLADINDENTPTPTQKNTGQQTVTSFNKVKPKKKNNLEDKICEAIDVLKERNAAPEVFPEVEHFGNLCKFLFQNDFSKMTHKIHIFKQS